jgi:hypothetical protein
VGRLQRLGSRITIVVALAVLLPARASAGDLDDAKKVYAEAMTALEAKDYPTATAKFEQAYRLAPDKHLFNYNIASAAELAGDCRKAQNHYQMFLDLVPKHDARKAAQKSLEKLNKTCAHDDETTSQLAIESREERDAERSKAGAQRALDDALKATQESVARYEAVVTRYDRAQPFAHVLRAKRRALKKIEKLMGGLGITPTEYKGDLPAPDTLEQACRQGEAQEERNAAAYAKAYERYDDVDVASLMDKLERKASGPHLRAFDEGCPRR